MKRIMMMAAAVMTVGSIALAEVKIGYVDLQKAIQSTSAGKKAKKELEDEFNKRKKDMEKKDGDIKKMAEDLEKKRAVMSEEALMKKQEDVQTEIMKFREVVSKNQLEIQNKERDLTKPILEKLKGIIDNIAKADGYTVILEKNENSVLWVRGDADLTEKVIKEFEKAK